jgi:hypothetical protein
MISTIVSVKHSIKYPIWIFFTLFFVLWIGPDAAAQKSTTSVSGYVYDQSGAVLSGAIIKLTQPGGSYSREAKTDANGSYRFDALLIGCY